MTMTQPETPAPQVIITDEAPRCWRCGRKLAELLTRQWRITCPRCHATNASPPILTAT